MRNRATSCDQWEPSTLWNYTCQVKQNTKKLHMYNVQVFKNSCWTWLIFFWMTKSLLSQAWLDFQTFELKPDHLIDGAFKYARIKKHQRKAKIAVVTLYIQSCNQQTVWERMHTCAVTISASTNTIILLQDIVKLMTHLWQEILCV